MSGQHSELESIVRDWARSEPWVTPPMRFADGYECACCNYQYHFDDATEEYAADPEHHLDDCPYRRARLWVLSHPPN